MALGIRFFSHRRRFLSVSCEMEDLSKLHEAFVRLFVVEIHEELGHVSPAIVR